ncbi:hypothetical protein [Shinella sp. HZN7]|uniref:acyltransferase n=1 Tax=Shinella sp. (strain HZN7) TaxID=879274 RepID=UPI000A7D8145|nr:hypothetical protein [Shinella sp. HZN7]
MFQFLRMRKAKRPAVTRPAPAPPPVDAPPRQEEKPPEGVVLNVCETGTLVSKLAVQGKDNVITVGAGSRIRGAIRIKGNGHRIIIGDNVTMNVRIIVEGASNTISIGNRVTLGGHILIKGEEQRVEIGAGTKARDVRLLCQEGGFVKIGRDCLFSRQVEIRTTDSHALVSRETGKRINLPGPVEIGAHVWMGLGVLVGKGVKIADDNVVGAKSFVAKPFLESGTVIAGVPAKVVKRGVTWQRDCKARYDLDKLDAWRALCLALSMYLLPDLLLLA